MAETKWRRIPHSPPARMFPELVIGYDAGAGMRQYYRLGDGSRHFAANDRWKRSLKARRPPLDAAFAEEAEEAAYEAWIVANG